MAAVLGGLGAAMIWSTGAVFASQAARILGPPRTLAWVMLVGLVLVGALLPVSAAPHLTGKAILWLALGGAGNVAGLLLVYRALRGGRLGVVMPIVATEGGVAALIAILAGQGVGAIRGVALIVTVVGVVMTALTRQRAEPRSAEPSGRTISQWAIHPEAHLPTGHGDRRAALWAVMAALSFGVSLFATGRAGAILPLAWAVLPPRLIGVAVITIPLVLRGRLAAPWSTARLLVIAGVCEVAGFLSYTVGARHGVAVAAVLSTLAGAMGTGIGRVLFGERLQRTQLLGVAVVSAGVATITGLSA
jgi:drug/metabolite transporter (DMT)-like permease